MIAAMTSEEHNTSPDLFSGYFASILLALLVSHLLSGLTITQIAPWFNLENEMAWSHNLAAGFFVGLVFADPVGVLLSRKPVFRALGKLVFGFVVGVLLQAAVVMPIAGEGMARFVFLIFMMVLLPFVFWLNNLTAYLTNRGIVPSEIVASKALKVMSLSDRALIIALMVLTFVGLVAFGATLQTTATFMTTVMVMSVLYVSYFQAPEEDTNPWFYPAQEEVKSIPVQAWERFRSVAASLAPGALILGATMRLVYQALLGLYSSLAVSGPGAMPMIETSGMLLLSALGMMLMASVTVLAMGLVVLILLAKVSSWKDIRTKEGCIRLIKIMSFRPLRRPF